ncbi:MAG: hypothetical protein MJZ64_06655 [Paludibacteraceae bacterium]|nr:hypothetical protein [Paludibacteraceae bacterium]
MKRHIIILITLLCIEIQAQTVYVDLNNSYFRENPAPVTAQKRDFFSNLASSVRENTIERWFESEEFWSMSRKMVVKNPFSLWANAESNTTHKTLKMLTSSIVEEVPVSYNSVTPLGEIVTVSGKMFLPKHKSAKGIIIASHYTIGGNSEAPSETFSFEGIFATKGYIVLMADYLGYGISAQYPHPYLNANNTAQVSVDLLKAALPYLQHRGFYPSTSNLILLGYSQGGAATIALERLIEQSYPQYRVQQVFAGAGPYNPAATYDYSVKENTTQIPCAVPMLILGMSYSEQLNLPIENYFLEPLYRNYQDWILSKNYSLLQINQYMSNSNISDLLTPLALDKTASPTNLFYEALSHNDLTSFEPKVEVYFFHSKEDNMVPFINSQLMCDSLTMKNIPAKYIFGSFGGHMNAAIDFFKQIYSCYL